MAKKLAILDLKETNTASGFVGLGAKAGRIFQKVGTVETLLTLEGHTHTATEITDTLTKVMMTVAERNKLSLLSNYTLTKAKIEELLTGDITTHTHSQYLTEYTDTKYTAGTNVQISGANVISATDTKYSLPTASGTTLGGIKVGTRLSISNGVLSATQQTANDFTTVLKNKLDGIAEGATNLKLGTSSSTAYRGDRGNAAYTHISDAVKHITADERTTWNNKWDYNATTIAGVKVTNATNADKATTLASARTIGISGGATGTATSFNGSKNITIPITAMDASKLSTGTLPDARLSGTYTGFSHKINGTNTIFTSPSSGSDSRGRTIFGLAEYRAHSSAATGAIVFIAPFSKASTIMKSIEIDGMIYSPSNAVRVVINNYTSGLTKKMSYGTVDIQVRVGETADGKFCVILGDVATKWYYPHFTLSKAMFSHSSVADTSCYGWTTALVTSLTGYVNISAEVANSPIVTNITGSATKLTTARTIGGVSFNGTANINLPGVNTAGNQNTSGTAAKATILANTRAINGTNFNGSTAITTEHWGTARTLSFTGDVTGTSSVNGSENVATAMTLANVATAGTYKSVTINAKGLVTSGTNPTTLAGYGITDAVTLNTTQTITGTKTFNAHINTGNITPLATASHNIGTSSLMYEKAYIRRIDTQSGYNLRFNVAGSEYMTINTSGNVGIGTTSPAYKLDVSGDVRATGTFRGSLTGNASSASAVSTSAENTGTTSRYILFANSASGNQALKTDSGLKYVPTTNTITATLAGNASSATKLQTARTIAGVSFDGSENIDIPFANLASKPTTLAGYGITALDVKNTAGLNADTLSLGMGSRVIGSNSIALGSGSWASGSYSIALGSDSWLSGSNSLSIMGYLDGDSSVTIGGYVEANNSVAIGVYSICEEPNTGVLGTNGTGGNGANKWIIPGNLAIGKATSATSALDVNGVIKATGVNTPKVDFGNGFTIEPSGAELVFKYNNVIKQRMLSDGSIVSTNELSAHQ